eukprot:438562-Amphidinium_carterae.5
MRHEIEQAGASTFFVHRVKHVESQEVDLVHDDKPVELDLVCGDKPVESQEVDLACGDKAVETQELDLACGDGLEDSQDSPMVSIDAAAFILHERLFATWEQGHALMDTGAAQDVIGEKMFEQLSPARSSSHRTASSRRLSHWGRRTHGNHQNLVDADQHTEAIRSCGHVSAQMGHTASAVSRISDIS